MISKLKLMIVLVTGMLVTNISTASAEDGSPLRIANYNIRFSNLTNGDTGDKAWANRRQYVEQVIKDYDFDIFGMEEVTGANRNNANCINPLTGKSQLQDLKDDLTDYIMLPYERSGNDLGEDYSYNVIAYKHSKLESLKTGCFWLSNTPDQPSNGWDSGTTIKRTCAWSKMQVKATGEIFLFAVIHCNYGATIDGRKSGKVACERLKALAGNYPVVLVGDFNMRRVDHETAYRGYASSFYDSALKNDTSYCLPKSNGETTITATDWNTINSGKLSGSEFDYIFYDKMHVLSRHIITENYGRSVNPSDHFPVMIQCTLNEPKSKHSLCVDSQAQANGDGSISNPFKTISSAVAAANINDTILVAEGTYSEQLSLPVSLTIIGGYSHDFTSVSGKSILDASASGVNQFINIPHYYNLTLNNLTLRNATSTAKSTDGAIYSNGYQLWLKNVDIENNSAEYSGGGMLATCEYINMDSCVFKGNSAKEMGGGACILALSDICAKHCIFEGNKAKAGSGMQVVGAETLCLTTSTFADNASRTYGALYLTAYNDAKNYSLCNNTFANNTLTSANALATLTKKYGGAAIYVQGPSTAYKFNMGHCTIAGNTSTFTGSNKDNFGGSAINIYSATAILMNNIIAGNYSDNGRGDLFVDGTASVNKEQYNIFTTSSGLNISPKVSDSYCSTFNIGLDSLSATIEGKVENDKFIAKLADNGGFTPTIKLFGTTYAGNNIQNLTSFLRLIDGAFGMDMDGDGATNGFLKVDQRGETRATKSVPGACEYTESTDISNIVAGQRVNIKQHGIYNLCGQRVGISVQGLHKGIYIIDGKKVYVK
jgi:endonuclease/exonuclease/phosphatase family metal-dependent hydrolase